MRRTLILTAAGLLLLTSCSDSDTSITSSPPSTPDQGEGTTDDGEPDDSLEVGSTDFDVTEHGEFQDPWAMEFVPETDLLLITERTGELKLRDQNSGDVVDVSGVPEVESAGQGGLHDVTVGPDFTEDQVVYLSWVETAEGGSRGVVGKARLDVEQAALENLEVIWEQDPAAGNGHFSLRMLVADDHLYVTSGDRQELDPAQDMDTNLGTIVRLTLEGDPAPENPFAADGGVAEQVWTFGHRNPLGIATDSQGRIWSSEMGPEGGDELNLITEGANYGWPEASMGVQYGGEEIPDHSADDDFEAPMAYWVPAISPGNLMIYQGELFDGWQDSALLGGLSGQNIVRVELGGDSAEPTEEWDVGERVRAMVEAPDGAIWIATDGGSLRELRPE